MKKIVTKATKLRSLQQQAKQLVVCSARIKYSHCLNNCFHGIPHSKDKERDAKCHIGKELCKIQKGIIRVVCKPLTIKQREEWIKKEMNK